MIKEVWSMLIDDFLAGNILEVQFSLYSSKHREKELLQVSFLERMKSYPRIVSLDSRKLTLL